MVVVGAEDVPGRPAVEVLVLLVADVLEEVAVLLGDLVVLARPDLQHRVFDEVVVDHQLVDQVVKVEEEAEHQRHQTGGRGDVEVEQLKDKRKGEVEDGDFVQAVEERVQLGDGALLCSVL